MGRSWTACLPLLVFLAACDSPDEVGNKAGALYMVPFGMSLGLETSGKPCPERLEIARELAPVDGKSLEVAESARKVAGDQAFRDGVTKATSQRAEVFERFAKKCPAEATQAIEVFAQVEKDLGLEGALPALEMPAPK